jgi:hypothetical protein
VRSPEVGLVVRPPCDTKTPFGFGWAGFLVWRSRHTDHHPCGKRFWQLGKRRRKRGFNMNIYFTAFLVSLFAFIFSLIGGLKCYFENRWKWLVVMIACIIVSGACTFTLLYGLIIPPPPPELPVVNRHLMTPL